MSGKPHKQKQKNTTSQPSGKGKQTKKDTKEELQNEIEKLKKKIVIYRNNLDPVKIRKEIDLTDQSMINILTDENLRLTEEFQKYTSRDTIESPSTQKATDTKKQSNVDRGDENKKESQQKQTEIEFKELKNENDILKQENIRLQNDNAELKNPSAQKATDTKKQSDVNRGDENKKDPHQKQTEIEFKELKNENDKLKQEIMRLQNDNAELKEEQQLNLKGQQVEQNANNNADTRSNHDEVLQQKATEIDELKEKVKELSSKLKEFEDIKTQLLNAKKSVEEKVEEKEKQIQEMIKEKRNIETEKSKLKNECDSIREQLKISEGQLEGMRKNSSNSDESTKSQADEIKQKLKEINDLKNNLTEAESKINNLKAERDTLEKKLRQLTNQVTTKEDEIKTPKEEHVKQLKTKDDTIQKLQTEKKVDQRKNSGKRNEGSNSLEEKLRSAQDEIDELKNRLSKVVGANIMNDNPNITDLSDENRPTKLSEKFSELYDNEWTDAYEEAENEFKTEEKGIAHLYKTLLDVFDFCKKKSEEHAKHIRDSVTTLPNAPKMRPKSAAIGVTNQRQLKEVRKSFAPMLIESVFQNYESEKKLNFTKKENTGKFIKKCVEICWLMNSQDPPVILDTSVVDGKSFDADKFKTYTKTGKLVDYVVWPPMLLHKGGPMLCKGVAQGK